MTSGISMGKNIRTFLKNIQSNLGSTERQSNACIIDLQHFQIFLWRMNSLWLFCFSVCSIRFSSCIIWCSYKQTQPEENKWEANRQKLAELREQSYKSVLFEILSPWTNSYVFPLRRLHKTAKVLFPLKFRVAQAAQRESRILPLSLIDPK